jgi:hypothetical protein
VRANGERARRQVAPRDAQQSGAAGGVGEDGCLDFRIACADAPASAGALAGDDGRGLQHHHAGLRGGAEHVGVEHRAVDDARRGFDGECLPFPAYELRRHRPVRRHRDAERLQMDVHAGCERLREATCGGRAALDEHDAMSELREAQRQRGASRPSSGDGGVRMDHAAAAPNQSGRRSSSRT